MVSCYLCQSIISRTKPGIFCEVCKKQAHSTCISSNKSIDILATINAVPGLAWKCEECRGSCISVNQADITTMLDTKVENAISLIQKQIASIKSDVAKAVKENSPSEILRYSDIVKNKTYPAVIIQPKNPGHAVSQTKADLIHSVDPCQSEVQLARVRNTKDGGLVVGCRSREENEKFRKLVAEKLSADYDIKEVKGISPRLRIVGFSEKYDEETLHNLILKCNQDIFSDDSECKIVKIFATRKNNSIFQAIVQFDKLSYEKIVKAGHLFIAYDSCSVFDAIEVYRCFKCNEFNHSATRCRKSVSCPICSGEHDVKQCKSQIPKCSNCIKLHATDNTISTDHAVWERDKCAVYCRALDKLKSDIFNSR